MTVETLEKGMELRKKIREAEHILERVIKYENMSTEGTFALKEAYCFDISEELAKKVAMLIKIETTAELGQLEKEFAQLGKE